MRNWERRRIYTACITIGTVSGLAMAVLVEAVGGGVFSLVWMGLLLIVAMGALFGWSFSGIVERGIYSNRAAWGAEWKPERTLNQLAGSRRIELTEGATMFVPYNQEGCTVRVVYSGGGWRTVRRAGIWRMKRECGKMVVTLAEVAGSLPKLPAGAPAAGVVSLLATQQRHHAYIAL